MGLVAYCPRRNAQAPKESLIMMSRNHLVPTLLRGNALSSPLLRRCPRCDTSLSERHALAPRERRREPVPTQERGNEGYLSVLCLLSSVPLLFPAVGVPHRDHRRQ